MKFLKSNNFIDLHEYKINPAEHYKIRPTKRKIVLAGALATTSFILPDAGVGLAMSGIALSPLPFKRALTNKGSTIKSKVIKKWYQLKK